MLVLKAPLDSNFVPSDPKAVKIRARFYSLAINVLIFSLLDFASLCRLQVSSEETACAGQVLWLHQWDSSFKEGLCSSKALGHGVDGTTPFPDEKRAHIGDISKELDRL